MPSNVISRSNMPRGRRIRHKACFTCRTRKVKCDEKRPFCERCRRSGFHCEGYQPTLDFVDETRTFSQNIQVSAPIHDAQSTQDEDVEEFRSMTQPSQSLDLSCFEEEMSVAYLLKHLISVPGSSNTEAAPYHWPGFLAIKSQQSLSYECLRAFAQMFFARQNNVQSTRVRGLQGYGSALRKLNRLLSSPDVMTSDDALISSMILSIYEFMTASSATNWLIHCLGFGNIVRLRGPRAYYTAHSRLLLEYNRSFIVFAALAIGQDTFLALPEWRALPWMDKKAEFDGMHEFVNIYVDLPGIKHDGQILQQRRAEDQELLAFFSRCLEMISRLKAWRTQWDISPEGQIKIIENDIEDELNPFPVLFEFTSFWVAENFLLYNASLLQVIELAESTHETARTNSPHNPPLLQPSTLEGLASLAKTAATEVCQSLEYELKSDFGAIGQLLVLFPIRMAWKAFGHGASPECRWLERLLGQLVSSGGWQCATLAITFDGAVI